MLRQARPLLAASPHAALGFSHAYLGAHWALHAAGEGGGAAPVHARAAARLHAEAAAALCDAAGEAAPHRRRAKSARSALLLARVAGSGLLDPQGPPSSRPGCRRGPRGGALVPAHSRRLESASGPPGTERSSRCCVTSRRCRRRHWVRSRPQRRDSALPSRALPRHWAARTAGSETTCRCCQRRRRSC